MLKVLRVSLTVYEVLFFLYAKMNAVKDFKNFIEHCVSCLQTNCVRIYNNYR